MKALILVVMVVFSVHGQELISTDGAEWQYIATGKDTDGAKFNVFARRVGNTVYPELEIRFGKNVIRAEHNCKQGSYRFKDNGEWAKPTGSVGAKLIKFACKK